MGYEDQYTRKHIQIEDLRDLSTAWLDVEVMTRRRSPPNTDWAMASTWRSLFVSLCALCSVVAQSSPPALLCDVETVSFMDVTDNHAEPPVSLALTPTSETKACAFDQEVTLAFNVNLKAPIRAENGTELVRNPVDIVCVIDVSSSMTGEPLELVKKSLHFLAQNLNEDDRLSLIVFSKQARLVFGLMALKGDENRLLVEHHINSLKPELWTNIGDGLFQGLSELQRARTDAVSSLLLFTDGKPTNGIKDMNVLVEMASRGVSMLRHCSQMTGNGHPPKDVDDSL